MFNSLKSNKKGQTGGLITGLIFGVASLVIVVVIAFVITSTLSDAELLTGQRTTDSVVNETGGNLSGTYQLTTLDTNYIPGGITIVSVYNGTEVVSSDNYTVSDTGVLSNLTANNWDPVNITFTSTVYSIYETSESNLGSNFTDGVDEISSKIPTVLLIAAVVLILGVLVLLVAAWQRMNLGQGI